MSLEKSKKGSGTEIRPCTCHDEYQDARYGKGRRVFNLGIKARTCTKCGKKEARSET